MTAEGHPTIPVAKADRDRSGPPADAGKNPAVLPVPIQAPIATRGPEEARASDVDPAVQATLAQVALKDKDWSVRITAVARLTLQSVLAQVALADADPDIRKLAVSRLKDQSALARVARGDKDWSVRIAAVNRLVNKGALTQVALNDPDPDLRKRAVERLTELP
jgi:hypothetical protein